MNLSPSGKISACSSSLIGVTDFSSFTISTSGVDISDYASVSLSGSFLSDSSDIRKPLCVFSSMSSYSEFYSTISSTIFSSGFSSSDPFYSFPVLSSKMGIPGAHSNITYWSKVGCFQFFLVPPPS